MTGDFNIKINNWDLLYSHYSVYTDTLIKTTDSFDLRLSISIIQVLIWYTNNPNESNSVIDLMFLWVNSEEINTYSILSDLWNPSNYAFLTVNIIISKEFIQDKWWTIIKNSVKEKDFINELKNIVGNINTTNISDSKLLERIV